MRAYLTVSDMRKRTVAKHTVIWK